MNYTVRTMRESEYPLLHLFLYEAIFIPEGIAPPPREIINQPELQVYVSGFGKQQDDHCIVAECDNKIVGAVWVRVMDDYGHVDDETPSLAISVLPDFRNQGIGTVLMKKMLDALKAENYQQVSLSVQKENYAVSMYRNVGFEIVAENEQEYIMICTLQEEQGRSSNA